MSKTVQTKISDIKTNDNNPRYITDEKFAKLVQSIKDFPEMLELRPIMIDENGVALGGNMRLKACNELGMKKVPTVTFTREMAEKTIKERLNSTNEVVTYEELCAEAVIKDNVSFGDWDWDMINEDFDTAKLDDWGMDVVEFEKIDYSILDDEDLDDQIGDLKAGVKKAIQIEFELGDYETASELVKHFRSKELYIGGFIIEKLNELKDVENKEA